MLHSVFVLHDEINNKYYYGPYNGWADIQEAKIWHRRQDAKRAKTLATREFERSCENAFVNYHKNPQNPYAVQEYFLMKTRSDTPEWGLKIVQFELTPVPTAEVD
jgi:hypothetical protein